jgi:hypothetical protein
MAVCALSWTQQVHVPMTRMSQQCSRHVTTTRILYPSLSVSQADTQRRFLSTKKTSNEQNVVKHEDSKCWSCGHSDTCPASTIMFCQTCGKLQSLEKHTKKDASLCYFDLLSQPKTVEVCESSLETEFRNMQKVLHPDKYANACMSERNLSMTNSSIVNQAYQVT